ncbi:MAG: AsmA family protein [Noviherbaspirillum sp.]|nr:AsmA family protein [Noviherbaspirillum sp.]
MHKPLKISLAVIASLVALIALLLVLLSVFDWNRVKPQINQKVSEATGRPFAINGDLSLNWKKPEQPMQGWRRWVPWPHLQAKDVTLGNTEWAKTGPDMARIQQIDFNVNLFPLFKKIISVSSLVLTEPELALERNKEGENNWTFEKKEKETKSEWKLNIEDVSLTRGNVRYVDPVKRADVNARIDTTRGTGGKDGIEWKVGGKFNGESVSGGGTAGALLSLQQSNVKYPVEANVKIGKTEISMDGTLTDPAHFSELDVNLKINGASMGQLFPLTGLLLPETPKFSTEGRVVGKIGKNDTSLRYEKFKGKVGSSDIGGTLEYVQRDPRPILRGDVVSQYLNLKDLGALLGSDSEEDRKKRGSQTKQPPGKVLPVEPFRTERWDKIDVQVQFTGKKIIRSEDLPIDNLFTKIQMDNGVLSLNPLNFGVAGGKLTTELKIDGQSNPAKAQMKISARGLKLKQLFPGIKDMQASLGQVHGDAQLSASGNSPAALLGSANGEVKALISQGSISKFILEAAGLNIGSAVVSKLFGDRQVQLNCMASDFKVTNGLMETRLFVVDTQDATILADGNINLAKEEMNLTIKPESKGIRIISLRAPLYVDGTFKNPKVGVDKGVVALKAGAAIALGALAAPIAGLLALITPGPQEDSPCGELLAQVQKKPVAPPPGKTAAQATSAKQ